MRILLFLFLLLPARSLVGQVTDCVTEIKDKISGSIRVDTKEELFFSHTDSNLRTYLKEVEYLSCTANLTYISGGYYFLNLSFAVASRMAANEFGTIQQGGNLEIYLINGDQVQLRARDTASGTYDTIAKNYTYQVQYAFSPTHIKQLKAGEVDRVRVVWTKGYKDYEVYYLDFFRNQFACIGDR